MLVHYGQDKDLVSETFAYIAFAALWITISKPNSTSSLADKSSNFFAKFLQEILNFLEHSGFLPEGHHLILLDQEVPFVARVSTMLLPIYPAPPVIGFVYKPRLNVFFK